MIFILCTTVYVGTALLVGYVFKDVEPKFWFMFGLMWPTVALVLIFMGIVELITSLYEKLFGGKK
jgi:hypothetical protein